MDVDIDSDTLLENLETFNAALADVLAFLNPLLTSPLQDTLANLQPLDRAKLNISIASAIDTLVFIYLRTQGINPKEHPVIKELERIKLYVGKVKAVEGTDKATWRLDKEAANRFIRAGLPSKATLDKTTADIASGAEDGEDERNELSREENDEGDEEDEAAGFLERVLSKVGELDSAAEDEVEVTEDDTDGPSTPSTSTPSATPSSTNTRSSTPTNGRPSNRSSESGSGDGGGVGNGRKRKPSFLRNSFISLDAHYLHALRLIFRTSVPCLVSVDSSTSPRRLFGGTSAAFTSILREEGWRGLYQGVSPSLVGASLSWGLYFYWYEIGKSWIRNRNGTPLGPADYLLASSGAGAITQVFTNPVWVVKTRMVTQKVTDTKRYLSMWDAVSRMYRGEGLRAFYKGMVPALVGVSHGAIQFTIYEELKNLWKRRVGRERGNSKPGAVEYIVMAAISKMVATVATSPAQVVRSRLQALPQYGGNYASMTDVIIKLVRNEGLTGFWKGLGPNLVRVLPGTMLTFGTYEWLIALFGTVSAETSVARAVAA
ncbi:hypothetical protein HDU93_002528 [Gonapodya sp. JEL0774]|nr:hypothetical protein HDU93_002528 [Gonapodya sp. JEL0774]